MINFACMPRPQSARLRVSVTILVASRAVLELQLIGAWLDSKFGCFRVEKIPGLSRISLLGNNGTRCGQYDQ